MQTVAHRAVGLLEAGDLVDQTEQAVGVAFVVDLDTLDDLGPWYMPKRQSSSMP